MIRTKKVLHNKMTFNSNRGSTPVVIICSTLIIILISAVLTDICYSAVEQFRMARIVEKTVAYGAEQLAKNSSNAEDLIRKYAMDKTSGLNRLDIKISDNRKELTVYMGKPFKYIFLKTIGYMDKQITSHATAKLSVVSAIKGIRPFAVQKQKFIYQNEYILSKGTKGNNVAYMPIDTGDGDYDIDVIFGHREYMRVGDKVKAVNQINGDKTKENLETLLSKCKHDPACSYIEYVNNCPRIITIPIVDSIEQSSEKNMNIVGFAAFFIESVETENKEVLIKGRFIRHTVNSYTSDGAEDFGLLGIKIIK